jgi:pimeloyl-ACP methyl ester carboxylesterase
MQSQPLTLATKPGASLRITTYRPTQDEGGPLAKTIVVFLNGLMLPRTSWLPVIDRLLRNRREAGLPIPSLICYDRYGQGDSDPDPTDPSGSPYGHDARVVIADLHQLLTQVCSSSPWDPLDETQLVFVCNSIGCPLARLYAAEHPLSVGGFIFLDSMMANSDFVSLLPDPDAAHFEPDKLPPEVSAEDLRHAREESRKNFHPAVPNRERFDRRNLAELLPDSDTPKLPTGPGDQPPYLTVVGHDWDAFAQQAFTVR